MSTVRLTKTGKPDGRSTSSKKNVSKARLAVKEALKKTFHPDEDVSSSEESDTDDECFDAIPVHPKMKYQPVVEVDDEYTEEIAAKDLKKSKKKADKSWESRLADELKKQEESWNNRLKQSEEMYQKQIKESEDKYVKAKVGTITNLRKSMMLKF